MKPIEKQSLKQKMIQEIKHYIIENDLKAGDKLPTERAFTELFGVSRSVIREALSYLENVGILRVRQGQGAFLKESNIENLLDSFFFLWQINNANIKEILGLRVIFECSAIDEIINHENDSAIARLKHIVLQAKQTNNPSEWRQLDIDFHQYLLQATNNALFTQLTNIITNYFYQIEYIELSVEEYTALVKEHLQIVDALEKKDAILAKAMLTKHLHGTKA